MGLGGTGVLVHRRTDSVQMLFDWKFGKSSSSSARRSWKELSTSRRCRRSVFFRSISPEDVVEAGDDLAKEDEATKC